MTVFVDTSALFAVLESDDAHHAAAGATWKELLERGRDLLTTNYVLLEVAVFLQNRLGLAALHTFNEDLAPLLRVEWIGPQQHHAATAAVLAAGRKKLSIVDCVSFQAMREHGVHTAFCIDRHFREQGFETIP
jgi:predicted nucleic acid-binding protein